MASHFVNTQQCFVQRSKEEEEAIEKIYAAYGEIVSTLPNKANVWIKSSNWYQYQGFWFRSKIGLEGIMWIQQHFKPRLTDVLLVTTPKSGTTWCKSLIFSILNRTKFDFSTHPLLTHSPHDCVPFMEYKLFMTPPIGDPEVLPSPRILATHIPFSLWPESVIKTECQIVYVCRNPKDVFISLWIFMSNFGLPVVSLEEAFDSFCCGVSASGPFWDHVLEYWKASLKSPKKILFLKYEEIIDNPYLCIKTIAQFLGYPFSSEEEESGVMRKIVELCSFDNMRNLEVNKTGVYYNHVKNNVFFRKGKVGDWKNYLTTNMVKHIDQITIEKFSPYGLSL